jgi:hypothetical protein
VYFVANCLEIDVLFVSNFSSCFALQLLSKSLDLIKDETWYAACGDAFIKHIPLYSNSSELKVGSSHTNDKQMSDFRKKLV